MNIYDETGRLRVPTKLGKNPMNDRVTKWAPAWRHLPEEARLAVDVGSPSEDTDVEYLERLRKGVALFRGIFSGLRPVRQAPVGDPRPGVNSTEAWTALARLIITPSITLREKTAIWAYAYDQWFLP